MRIVLPSLLVLLLTAVPPASAQSRDTLDVYFVDVEGGQATLFVSPSGESLLIDAGYAGVNGRDADRIVAAAHQAGVTQIDYLVITHFHGDHIGGVPDLAAKIPIRTFVDSGESVESDEGAQTLFKDYTTVRSKGRHVVAKPGAMIPFKGIDVRIVAAAAELIKTPLPLPGTGTPNPLCAVPYNADTPKARLRPSTLGKPWTENRQSVATHFAFGNFRMVDFGDLDWDQERNLACPNNLLGTADVYLTTAHGQQISGPAAMVHALHPRAIIMNNAVKKGGDSPTMTIVRGSPGADVWQLHFAMLSSKEENAPESFISNLGETDTGHWIKISAKRDGSFVVTNGRNNFSKAYGASH